MKKILKLLIPATTLIVPASVVACAASDGFVALPVEHLNIQNNVLLGIKEQLDHKDILADFSKLSIPANVLRIEDGSFKPAPDTDGSLVIKKIDFITEDGKTACTKFGNGSFTGCTNLETVVFPPEFSCTDELLFGGCSNLSTLDFSKLDGLARTFNPTLLAYDDFADSGKIIVRNTDQEFGKSLVEKLPGWTLEIKR